MSARTKRILALLNSTNKNDPPSNEYFSMVQQSEDIGYFDILNLDVITAEELQTQTHEGLLLTDTNVTNNSKCDNLKDCIPDLKDCLVTESITSNSDNVTLDCLDIINADDPSIGDTQIDLLYPSPALGEQSVCENPILLNNNRDLVEFVPTINNEVLLEQHFSHASSAINDSSQCNVSTNNDATNIIHPLVPYEVLSDEENGYDSDASYKPLSNSESDTESETDVTTTIEKPCIDEENVNEGRKRKADESDWCRIKNKKLRMEGKAYVGFKKEYGKIKQNCQRLERSLKPSCNSSVCKSSKIRFCSRFGDECRQEIFMKFWQETNWEQRKTFVSSHVLKKNVARTSSERSRRQGTFVYFLNNGEEKLQVCRTLFINMLNIGYKTVQEWVNKSSYGMAAKRCIQESVRDRFMEGYKHLNSFFQQLPKLPAHYCRKDTLKLYLESSFQSLSELYRVYQGYCNEQEYPSLSRNVFNKMFHEKNLSLFRQKKDQCNICFAYKYKNETEEKWTIHVVNKEKARKAKTTDKELAERGEVVPLTLDLQAVKLAPFLPAGKIYFKTKLCCHNFTVYNLATRDVTCYWFSEDQNNQLQASTFTSCIIDFLEKNCLTTDKLPIIMYSDGCGYQNRNIILSNAILNFSIKHQTCVYQKYLEPGHTQMECDSFHSTIERKLRHREIHLPSDYAAVTKESRLNPKPYNVKILNYTFFKNFSDPKFLRYPSIRPGKNSNDPTVNDIKCIKYTAEGKIQVKLDYDSDYVDLPVRPKNLNPINDYPQLLKSRCKIKKEKWQHLQDLKSVLPQDTHLFYDNLLSE